MWNMVPFGILMPSLRPADTVPEGDNRLLQIRSRRKKDLNILREKYMGDELGDIVQLPHSDYEYRAYCTHEAYARAMYKMVMDIDFVKFKPTTDRYNDGQLHSLYNSLWGTIFSQLSTPEHQNDYLGIGTGSVGKYGTTYGGTGNFSYGSGSGYAASGKRGKKGRGKYESVGGGRQPWWADADAPPQTGHWWDDEDLYKDDPYVNDQDDLGLGRETDGFDSLMESLVDMDPALKPVFTSKGEIDHLYCDHGISKSAKKRCRARWRRYARTRTPHVFGAAR